MKLEDVGYVIDHNVWLTPSEAALLWGCAKQTIYQKKSAGRLPDDCILQGEYEWWIRKDCSAKPRAYKSRRQKTDSHTPEHSP